MKHRPLFAVLSGFSALALAAMACGGGPSAEPTATKVAVKEATATPEEAKPTKTPKADKPTATAEPTKETGGGGGDNGNTSSVEEGKIGVASLNVYIDDYGYYHVAGEIHNRLDSAVGSVELSLAVVDGEDKTVLTESDEPVDSITFSPQTYYMEAGEFATFDYYFYPEDGTKPEEWKATVGVTNFEETKLNRAKLSFENQFTYVDEDGHIYLSGEIVNEEDKAVTVRGLSGAVADADGNVLGASYGYAYAGYLFPAGSEGKSSRTPYVIMIYGPLENADTSYLYVDAEIAERDPDEDVDVAFEDVEKDNFYVDQYDRLHLVTSITNNGKDPVNVRLVAALYDKDGKALDSSSSTTPIYIHPGETLPLDFSSFYSANSNEEVRDAVDSYVIKMDLDPFWTYVSSYESLNFTSDEAIKDGNGDGDDGSWTFTGTFVSPAEKDLSYAYIVVVITDKATGNAVATSYTSVYPEGDAFKQGDEAEFEIYLQLDPDLDIDTVEYQFLVQGYPKD